MRFSRKHLTTLSVVTAIVGSMIAASPASAAGAERIVNIGTDCLVYPDPAFPPSLPVPIYSVTAAPGDTIKITGAGGAPGCTGSSIQDPNTVTEVNVLEYTVKNDAPLGPPTGPGFDPDRFYTIQVTGDLPVELRAQPTARIAVTVSLNPDPPVVVPEPEPALVTLNLNANGGSCNVSSVSGGILTWVALPGATACSRPSHDFVGWATGPLQFTPGQSVQLISDNTLTAVWKDKAPEAAPDDARDDVEEPGQVVWRAWPGPSGKLVPTLMAGDPKKIQGNGGTFTIVCNNARLIKADTIAAAKALADQYGGIYMGTVIAGKWKKPRIVADYR